MPPRFYYEHEITVGRPIELSVDIRHHATRVLRLKEGDTITLFNGKAGEYSAHIIHTSKSNTTVVVDEHHTIERESPLIIELAQAICVNEKMDWIIQKAVELGATHIQPVVTNRSVVRLSEERATKRLQHWQKIIIAACEQCGRNYLPHIQPLISLPDWLSTKKKGESPQNLCFMLSTTAKIRLNSFSEPPPGAMLTLLVGPEGGFTHEEEIITLSTGFTPLHLGQRILRTESAALATIAAMQTLWGDY